MFLRVFGPTRAYYYYYCCCCCCYYYYYYYYYYYSTTVFLQTMNILVVYQSVVDMGASFFTLLTAVVEVDATRMSRRSAYDQFVCHVWLGRLLPFSFILTSTYGILATAVDRYVAVIHPVWYNNNVYNHDHTAG